MSVPGIVQSTLGSEEIAARVSLGGDDELFVTSTRTLVYRADGLLSDESVEEYSHDADRLTLSEGRRKTKFTLEYSLEGTQKFTIPSSKTDAVLHPVLAGILNGNEITEPGETVVQTYRFSELTLIITSERLVKHIGGAVWDEDYQEYHFSDVTELAFEDGSVATQIVLTVDGRPQRIKAPNEQANDLRERLKRALFDYYDVDSLEELNELVGENEDWDDGSEDRTASMDFGDSVDPLSSDSSEQDAVEPDVTTAEDDASAEPTTESTTDPLAADNADVKTTGDRSEQPRSTTQRRTQTDSQQQPERTESRTEEIDDEFEPATVETANVFDAESKDIDSRTQPPATADPDSSASDAETTKTDPELLERIDALEDAVERQSDVIDEQRQMIEQLIAELRQGR
ncbi:DUF7115 domain-containing protein [Natronobacterium gregoryi]|uniref:DUF7115 domain-containing protein n=2 Tax=Natronobacterium gregoryi TaxID=44930 RepID=L0ALV4_NATGS|nr:hypothetical protein [Natronobacterium gregoryi]AFZ74873.1 hypothetical protein Natgr_3771 [Natronobacterium gregoryi SP2]ELY73291.1 hypothetical protein C490_01752 [Natronobacterium gregoryi SP2]PLK19326.1 hypothetical protein CYV19_15545 [Natronobacterium gregoryi SP2]SFJ53589.1 hypothetical protein SAMN05443661_13718 [Natronobacterium gregoryi]